MGLAAFVFFVVPWMIFAAWLFRLPDALRLGVPPTPWRPLTDYPDPPRDQRTATSPHNRPHEAGSSTADMDKHRPLEIA